MTANVKESYPLSWPSGPSEASASLAVLVQQKVKDLQSAWDKRAKLYEDASAQAGRDRDWSGEDRLAARGRGIRECLSDLSALTAALQGAARQKKEKDDPTLADLESRIFSAETSVESLVRCARFLMILRYANSKGVDIGKNSENCEGLRNSDADPQQQEP